jgi:hypothetical protein
MPGIKTGHERAEEGKFMDLIIIAAIVILGILALCAVTGALLTAVVGLAAALWIITRNQGERI